MCSPKNVDSNDATFVDVLIVRHGPLWLFEATLLVGLIVSAFIIVLNVLGHFAAWSSLIFIRFSILPLLALVFGTASQQLHKEVVVHV